MKNSISYLIMISVCLMASCSLKDPPTCLTGAERCEPSRIMVGTGIYQECNDNGDWGNEFVCSVGCSSTNNGCRLNDKMMPSCNEDGIIQCLDNDDITLSFECRHGYWNPKICHSDKCSEESGCIEEAQGCNNSESFCTELSGIGALQAICGDDRWTITYCPKGSGCDGNICADNSIKACGDDRVNCKEIIAHWGTGACTAGECIVTECMSGYHLYENESVCEENTKENCGSHGHACPGEEACNKNIGECGCDNGLIACGGECIDIYHSMEHCGRCDQKCEIANGTDVSCESGKCKVKSCEVGYHLYDNTCEKDDNTNCGSHGSSCTKDMIEGSETVACENAQCMAKTCDNEHQLNGGVCLEKNCVEGSSKCVNTASIGKMYECINNTWTAKNTCEGNHSCNAAETACGDCKNSTVQCDGLKPEVCVKGEWSIKVECSTSIEHARATCSVDIENYCGWTCEDDYYASVDNTCIQCNDDEEWNELSRQCEKVTCVTKKNIAVGDYCKFGRYMQDADGGVKDLEWQVLDIDSENNSLFLITKYVIDAKPYNKTIRPITWEKSTLRSWLNGLSASSNSIGIDYTDDNFMKTAFDSDEMKYINKVYSNPNPDYNGTPGGNDTDDYVFLLSYEEVLKYYNDENDDLVPVVSLTEYVKSVIYDYTCDELQCIAAWWLRSPGNNNKTASNVSRDGRIYLGHDVNTAVGIRPVLWINR